MQPEYAGLRLASVTIPSLIVVCAASGCRLMYHRKPPARVQWTGLYELHLRRQHPKNPFTAIINSYQLITSHPRTRPAPPTKARPLSSTKPTILQIIPRLDTGGAEISTIEMTEAVLRAGGRMLVASEGGRLAEKVTKAGGELIDFPARTKNPMRIWGNARKLETVVKEHGVDLIHARSRAPAWSAFIAARRLGLPFVTTYHGAYSEQGRLKNRYNAVMARGDVVIANSHYTAGLIRRRYGTDSARIRVIHRGVDVERFDPVNLASERVAALRQNWGVADDERIVLQAARLTSWKGHRVVIAAAGRLLREEALGKAVVIFAGDAQGREGYVSELNADIAAEGLGNCVRLVGHCDDMPAAFAAAQVAIVGSDGTTPEAFGRAAAEAQAAGCPVIAADYGAPPETVKAAPKYLAGEATGWLVPSADVEALAACLKEALALDAGARTSIGQRARRNVMENFTDETMKRQTLLVYDELLHTQMQARFDALADGGKAQG